MLFPSWSWTRDDSLINQKETTKLDGEKDCGHGKKKRTYMGLIPFEVCSFQLDTSVFVGIATGSRGKLCQIGRSPVQDVFLSVASQCVPHRESIYVTQRSCGPNIFSSSSHKLEKPSVLFSVTRIKLKFGELFGAIPRNKNRILFCDPNQRRLILHECIILSHPEFDKIACNYLM